MSKVALSIKYAGLELQVVKNEHGQDVTPLKPISDIFGLNWEGQRKKATSGEFYPEHFRTCTLLLSGAGDQKREQTCILLSRVSHFLMMINPDAVKAQGNIDGAKYLSERITEWADALHDYESVGVAMKNNTLATDRLELSRINSLARLIAIKNKTEALADRKAIEASQQVVQEQLGIPFQSSLI